MSRRVEEPVSVWNPIGFDPSDHLPPLLHRHGDCARYFLHLIHYANVFRNAPEFVPLQAQILRRYFPGNNVYKHVRDGLIERGVIACDHQYIIGQKSYGYQLGPEFQKTRQHKIALTDRTLTAKIRAHRQDWVRAPDAVHRHLLDNLRRVEIDYPAALEALRADECEPAHETALQLLRDREFFFHVCAYGRVHTNLTNLKTTLRPFLSSRGQPLVNLDIRNSQPLFFSILLKDRYGAGPLPPDVAHYIALCQDGQFYDHLMSEAGIPEAKRGAFKQKFFGHVFFCKNWPETEAARLFGQQFPSVSALVREQKERDYTALAKNLQRAESDLMIGTIAAQVMRERPDAFLGTIHDSILTTPDEAEPILGIMREEFAGKGLRPTIRVERL